MAEEHTAEIIWPKSGYASLNAPGRVMGFLSSSPDLQLGKDFELDSSRGVVRPLSRKLQGQSAEITVSVEPSLNPKAQQKALDDLRELFWNEGPAMIARLDGIVAEDWPRSTPLQWLRIRKDLQASALFQRRMLALILRLLVRREMTDLELPPEPNLPE